MLVGAIIIVALIVIGGILFIFWPKIKRQSENKNFRRKAYNLVYRIAKNYDYYLINNVKIKVDNKNIHFNHILFGDKYIYAIGVIYKNNPLSGSPNDQQWLEYEKINKVKYITNPLLLHHQRIDYFKSIIKSNDIVKGIILVNDSCILDESKQNMDDEIIMINEAKFESYVKKLENSNVPPIDAEQLKKLVHLINDINEKNLKK